MKSVMPMPPDSPENSLAPLVQTRLEAVYGVAKWHRRIDPMDELVSCILSQHNSDINTGRAFESLKKSYPTWESVIEAPTPELIATIRHGGLANIKAPRIQNALRRILSDQGTLSLDCLDTMTDPEARAYLLTLPGVGPKTAAIVLSFALGRAALAVDTHIFRVAWRIGLIEKKIGEAKAHDALQAQIAPDQIYRFHVALITHGRQTCKAPTPRCSECALTDLCRTYREATLLEARNAATNAPSEPTSRARTKVVKKVAPVGQETWRRAATSPGQHSISGKSNSAPAPDETEK